MTDKILALTTCRSDEEARTLANALVEAKLAACVSILPWIESVYRWKDAIERSDERLLIVKTRRDMLPDIEAEIRRLHSYELPELIAIPIVDGITAYLDWIDKETRSS